MKYKDMFKTIISSMDDNFNWEIKLDNNLIDYLIKTEIKENHHLYGKEIIPIAICKNKYDLLAYYIDNDKEIIVTIHFKGYQTNNDNDPHFEIYKNFDDAIDTILLIYKDLYQESRYKILIESENIKKIKSQKTLPGLYNILKIIYDVLLKMDEYRGKLADNDEIDLLKIQDLFQFFSSDFPYKIRSIFLLSEIGNYSDACILLRSLTESFFYFKYYILKNDGKKLSYYINQSKKNTTKIKDIMDSIAPTYYDTVYNELCKFTHGNPLMIGLFRGNVSKDEPLKHNMYNININWYSYIINLTIPLIVGYFNMYKVVYKNNTLKTNTILNSNMQLIYKFILGDIKDRYNKFPCQRKTIDLYNKIISF